MNSEYSNLAAHDLVDEYRSLLLTQGIQIANDREYAWQRYVQLSTQNRIAIIKRLDEQIDILRDVCNAKVNPRNPVQTVWRILQKFNWKPPADLFGKIRENSVTEIFLPDGTQLFRSMNYFKFTTYSLPELLFIPWYELFEHPAELNRRISEFCASIFIEQSARQYYELPAEYIGREKLSPRPLEVKLSCKSFSPLISRLTNQNEALIVIWDMDLAHPLVQPPHQQQVWSSHEKENL